MRQLTNFSTRGSEPCGMYCFGRVAITGRKNEEKLENYFFGFLAP
jgi:hypothetical protein